MNKVLQADSSISVAYSPNKPISHLEGSRTIFTFGWGFFYDDEIQMGLWK